MSTANKLLYLGETKLILKDTINMSNANITNSTTFRNYATQLKEGYIDILNNGTDTLYNNFTHLTGKDMTLSFAPTYQAPMKITCYGSTSQASTPTPSSPVDVVNTTGNQSINVCGKNLFDKNNVINAFLNSDGTTTTNSTFRVCDYINVNNYEYITISGNSGSSELVCFYDENKNHINANVGMGSSTSKTITIPNEAVYMRATIKATILNEYQIEVGQNTTTYETYNGTNYNIGLGNIELCKIGDYEDKIDKSTGKNIIGELITNSAAWASGAITTRNGWSRTDYIPIKPNISYYIQHTAGSNVAHTGWCYDENKTTISPLSLNGDYDVSGAVAMPNNAKYMIINFYSATITTNLPMINEGTTALPYEPYGTDWYLKKNIGVQDILSSELGNFSSATNLNNVQFTKPTNDKKNGIVDRTIPVLCNKLAYSNRPSGTYDDSNLIDKILDGGNSKYFVGLPKTITTLEEAQTYLATLKIYYILATPTYTKITDSTLIEQLEAIKSKDNTTNITSSMVIGAIALKKE